MAHCLKSSGVKEGFRLRCAKNYIQREISSVDGSISSDRVAFNLIELCKGNIFPEVSAVIACPKLKSKYGAKGAPILLVLKSDFPNSRLT